MIQRIFKNRHFVPVSPSKIRREEVSIQSAAIADGQPDDT